MEGIDIVAENIIKIEQVKEEPVDIEEPISIRENDPNQVWCSVKILLHRAVEVLLQSHRKICVPQEDDHSHEWCSVKAENIVEDLLAPYCESSTSKNHEDLLCSSGIDINHFCEYFKNVTYKLKMHIIS
ncbi:Protein of unknown function [Gryllus bimaculatus]|nr:Protein of unknown function [Gryllus bimaculatus]